MLIGARMKLKGTSKNADIYTKTWLFPVA